ncbi:MAG TPA: BON domain-containing protein [Bryobacteraceae bacterium]|nr:BON domain-containing protein [Bryobacteraceae bacterium]
MDEALLSDIIREFKWDPQITSKDIGGSIKDGVVTIYGFVSSYMEKDAAERAAKRVRGVRAVANDLELKPQFTRTDPEIARDVVQDMVNHIFLPADRVTVTVRNGWVTLEGIVDWQYQRKLAEDSAKKIRGVMGITNNIVLKPRVSTTDVKTNIEQALQRNALVDAHGVTVQADGTLVRLSGTVRSWAEKEQADEAAWSAPGVTSVDNQIVIMP